MIQWLRVKNVLPLSTLKHKSLEPILKAALLFQFGKSSTQEPPVQVTYRKEANGKAIFVPMYNLVLPESAPAAAAAPSPSPSPVTVPVFLLKKWIRHYRSQRDQSRIQCEAQESHRHSLLVYIDSMKEQLTHMQTTMQENRQLAATNERNQQQRTQKQIIQMQEMHRRSETEHEEKEQELIREVQRIKQKLKEAIVLKRKQPSDVDEFDSRSSSAAASRSRPRTDRERIPSAFTIDPTCTWNVVVPDEGDSDNSDGEAEAVFHPLPSAGK